MPLTKIQSLGITDGTIVNADINASAAIAGTKLSGAGKILQVVSTAKTDTFTTTSTSLVDVTGLSVSITPSSASNKILIFATVNLGTTNANFANASLLRGSTEIFIGDASTNRTRATFMSFSGVSNEGVADCIPITFLDSPNSTSSLTYKIQILCPTAGTTHVNKSHRDQQSTTYDVRLASSITVMEIAA